MMYFQINTVSIKIKHFGILCFFFYSILIQVFVLNVMRLLLNEVIVIYIEFYLQSHPAIHQMQHYDNVLYLNLSH